MLSFVVPNEFPRDFRIFRNLALNYRASLLLLSIFLVSRVEKKREAGLRANGYYDDEGEMDAHSDDPLMAGFDAEDGKEK